MPPIHSCSLFWLSRSASSPILFDRLAGPSWLARQFSGSSRGIVTSVLVGVAGSFVGYHIALLALGGGLMTSLIAAAAGAAVVLFIWRMVK